MLSIPTATYKCKGCPSQNQCTLLQFLIRRRVVRVGHSCPPPFYLDFDFLKPARPVWHGALSTGAPVGSPLPVMLQDSCVPRGSTGTAGCNQTRNLSQGRRTRVSAPHGS